MSRVYEIPLKYPIVIDGSHSAIILRNFAEVIRFFHIPNEIEQNELHIKKGVFFLNENLRQVMRFFGLDGESGREQFYTNFEMFLEFMKEQVGV